MNIQTTNLSFDKILIAFKRGLKRHWAIIIVLAILGACIAGLFSWFSYVPEYTASTTFTVYVKNTVYSSVSAYNSATAKQMAKTFPDILTSGVLSERVMEELDIDRLPVIEANAVEDSNLFELRVRGRDPKLCEKVLQSVIDNYPDIAERVVGPTEMTIVDRTGVPQTPDNQRNWSDAAKKGVLIGVVAGVLYVFAYGALKKTIMGRDDVQRISNTPYLGSLPTVVRKKRSNDEELVISLKSIKDQNYRDAFRILSSRVNKTMKQNNYKTLMVCSAIPGEGKTTVSFNMAISLSEQKRKVLLVDCDLRSPSLYRMLKRERCAGVTEWIGGEVELSQIITEINPNQLDVLFAGYPTDDGAEILGSEKFHELLHELRKMYDVIVLDTPPCSMLADATELASEADCTLMVIKQDHASRDSIVGGLSNLQDRGTPIIGYVLNQYSGGVSGRYGYGYGYGKYGYGYGYGYGSKSAEGVSTEAPEELGENAENRAGIIESVIGSDNADEAAAVAALSATVAELFEKPVVEEEEPKGFFARLRSKKKKADVEKPAEIAAPIAEPDNDEAPLSETKISEAKISDNKAIKIKVSEPKSNEAKAIKVKVSEPKTAAPKAAQKAVAAVAAEAPAVKTSEVKLQKPKAKKKQSKGGKVLKTIVIILVSIALLLALAVLALSIIGKKAMTDDGSNMNITAIGATDEGGGTIRYKGKLYKYNNSVSSILLMGIDNYQKSEIASFGDGNQSDVNVLAVMDPHNKKLTLISLSRDTMCDFEVLNDEGQSEGVANAQLALAYSYGDGAERSCELTTEAVSKIFYDLNIPAYGSIYMNGIVDLVDVVGGVTVTPTESFKNFSAGKSATINGDLAKQYIQYRKYTVNGNNERMQRQSQVLMALVHKALASAKADPSSILNLYNEVQDNVTTNLNAAKIVYLASQAAKLKFDGEIHNVPGHSEMGEQKHAVYVIDEDAFYDMIVNTFYIPVEG